MRAGKPLSGPRDDLASWKSKRDRVSPYLSMLVQAHSPKASIPLPFNEVSCYNFCAFDLHGGNENMVETNHEEQNSKDIPKQEFFCSPTVQSSSGHPNRIVWPLGEAVLDPGF